MNPSPRRVDETNVVDYLRPMASQAESAEILELDLDAMNPTRVAASVIAAALLTTCSSAKVRVKLPSRDPERRMAHSGLLFALAHRPGDVEFRGSHRLRDYFGEWRRPWTRGTREPLLRLLAELEPGTVEPSVFGRDYAAFVNPHRATGVPGTTSGVAEVVRPWLNRLLPRLATNVHRTPDAPAFVQEVGQLIDELVENVAQHATQGRSRDLQSMALVSLARGGEVAARHRLHIIVLDTGPGILQTAEAKLRRQMSLFPDAARERADLLRGLFRGHVRDLGRARGFGLPRVWETVRYWEGGRLFAIANATVARSAETTLHADPTSHVTDGSIVAVTFTLPPRRRPHSLFTALRGLRDTSDE